MKKKNGLFLAGMAPFALIFIVACVSCTSMSAKTDGVEYVPATWEMKKVETILFARTTKSLPTDKEGKPPMSNIPYREADLKDGVTIREYAENAGAKAGVWYAFTAPERPNEFFYAYKKPDGGNVPWLAVKVDPDRASDKAVSAFGMVSWQRQAGWENEPMMMVYLPIWKIEKAANPPSAQSLEKVASDISFSRDLCLENYKTESIKGVMYFSSLFRVGTPMFDSPWYVCTSSEVPGETYYINDDASSGVDTGWGASVAKQTLVIYRQK